VTAANPLLPEAWPPAESWRADDIGSRCPLTGYRWQERDDPMWSGLFDGDSYAAWSSITQVRRMSETGVAYAPKKALARTQAEAVAAVVSANGGLTRLRMASVVHLWRTVTLPQWAALSGSSRAAEWSSFEALPLFQSGLVDAGQVRAPGVGTWAPSANTGLARPGDERVWNRQVSPRLGWTQWLAVSAGFPWSSGRGAGSDRHNVLATELGLRLMEAGEVSAVLPEGLCDVGVLAGLAPGTRSTGTADMAMVRPDGARISVEVTCNAGEAEKMGAKIRKWVRALGEPNPLARAAGVVFLVAPRRPSSSAPAALRRLVMRRVAAEVADQGVPDRVARRIGVASWREWFPSDRLASREFFDLSVAVLRTTVFGTREWVRESWSCPAPAWGPDTSDQDALSSVGEQTRVVAGIPRWFRDAGPEPLLAGLLLRAAGRSSFPSRTRPDGMPGRPVGFGWGAAGPAGAPLALANRL